MARILLLLCCVLLAACASEPIRNVSPEDAASLIHHGAKLVDVRTVDERTESPTPREALWVPFAPTFMRAASNAEEQSFAREMQRHFSTSDTIVLICGGGMRSQFAGEALIRNGFSNVLTVTGGIRGDGTKPGWFASGRL